MIPLPRLELAEQESYVSLDGVPEMVDEAVVNIDGREEETITFECPGARELAERIARLVNHQAEVIKALEAAAHALRSYEFFGNTAEFWLNMQAAVDLWDARQKIKDDLARIKRAKF